MTNKNKNGIKFIPPYKKQESKLALVKNEQQDKDFPIPGQKPVIVTQEEFDIARTKIQSIIPMLGRHYSPYQDLVDIAHKSDTLKEMTVNMVKILEGANTNKINYIEDNTNILDFMSTVTANILPPLDARLNGAVKHPRMFRQGVNIFVEGISSPIGGHAEPSIWWQHVKDIKFVSAFQEWFKIIDNVSRHPQPFVFCLTKADGLIEEEMNDKDKIAAATNYSN